ncbi:MAG: DUF4131 domain-containing protein [Nanoarchaeota archaeon]|nr:DUF4131 domain-containing protein [Nanoarchaeota archaeon]MBU1051885.1 DUF4131 domain-containing protein [Nanoarchaeota archaeon]MBU1988507.1 DUF4131 domain-containing protein [Nanoarchaeota archaeon]
MRRWAFIIAIVGMFVLLLLLSQKPVELESYDGLEELEINERVYVTGKVVEEKVIYGERKVLVLDVDDGEIDLVFEGFGSFKGEEIEVVGKVGEYEGKKQIEVERILS